LVAVDTDTLTVDQLSRNWGELVSGDLSACLGRPLGLIFGEHVAARLIGNMEEKNRIASALREQVCGREFDIVQHRSGGSWIVELEPIEAGAEIDSVALIQRQGEAIARLQEAAVTSELCEEVARQMSALSGYDRVMVYRFHPDWHGEVIAECLRDDMEPFLGLHYPASDIPEQARRLYTRNWQRLIVTADYEPVPLVPALNPRTSQPLDLTNSALRSVSPVHCAYLRNMGVSGSMSVSLLCEGRLWGLIACHHRTPRRLPFAVRLNCEMIGRVASALLAAIEKTDAHRARLSAKAAREGFLDRLAEHLDFAQALTEKAPEFLELLSANGAVLQVNGVRRTMGEPLPTPVVDACFEWLHRQESEDLVFTDQLGVEVPAAASHATRVSGLLAVPLTETGADWLVWFRPEHAQTVHWAGNPNKDLSDLSLPIQPRKSFALWTQHVTGRSAPWTDFDRLAAQEIRAAVNASIRKRTERLLQINSELEQKNVDLNSFAFIASHDLREPLRGIRNSIEFFVEDHGGAIPEEGHERLALAARTAERMHDMIEGLLHYTRVGRAELSARPVEMNKVLKRAMENAQSQWSGQNVRVEIAPDLPTARCNPVMMAEVFTNLLTNAVKYNRREEKTVEIFARQGPPGKVVFCVRDNGIGIPPRHLKDIFTIFRRLHPRDAFGGGVGVGLAIVKAVIERHGGAVEVESVPNEGTTFNLILES